jgi:hypothetical protein
MGPVVRIVEEPEADSSLEIAPKDGREELQLQGLFEGPPQTLHDGNGAGSSDRTETMADIEPGEISVKLSEELLALIGDEVFRDPETSVSTRRTPS